MILYHATLKSNLSSIQREGLDPKRATGKEKVIWLHTKSRSEWAILHTARRHNANFDEIVIITVKVNRSKLRRRWRGLWSTSQPIKTIASVMDAITFGESPIRNNHV